MTAPIPVLCDRCRAAGVLGESDFSDFAHLLDFTPVPRRTTRVDGWDAERQRSFIVALAATGSKRRAAAAVGKAQFGVDQLLKAEGSESFAAACEAAIAFARETGRHRLSTGLGAVAGEAPRPAPPAAPGEEGELSPAQREVLEKILNHYWQRLGMEREARLAGRIAEADFYVRQITWLEVAMDLASGDGIAFLEGIRRGKRHEDHNLLNIAETRMSRLLDNVRRKHWREIGAPERPEHPPRDSLTDHGDYWLADSDAHFSGPLSIDEQRRQYEAKHAEAARKQVEWEAEARREYERRRDSGAANNQEPGSAGQPAPEPSERRQDSRHGFTP